MHCMSWFHIFVGVHKHINNTHIYLCFHHTGPSMRQKHIHKFKVSIEEECCVAFCLIVAFEYLKQFFLLFLNPPIITKGHALSVLLSEVRSEMCWHQVHCVVDTAHCTLHTAHSAQHRSHIAHHTAYCTPHTAHSTPYTVHPTQHTAHST